VSTEQPSTAKEARMPRTDQEDRIAKVREELPREQQTIAASE